MSAAFSVCSCLTGLGKLIFQGDTKCMCNDGLEGTERLDSAPGQAYCRNMSTWWIVSLVIPLSATPISTPYNLTVGATHVWHPSKAWLGAVGWQNTFGNHQWCICMQHLQGSTRIYNTNHIWTHKLPANYQIHLIIEELNYTNNATGVKHTLEWDERRRENKTNKEISKCLTRPLQLNAVKWSLCMSWQKRERRNKYCELIVH